MRTWYPVSVPAFYNPVTSLLKPAGEKDTWSGMRTTGQLRLSRGIKLKASKDSLYKVQSVTHVLCRWVSPRSFICNVFCGLNFQVESLTLNLNEHVVYSDYFGRNTGQVVVVVFCGLERRPKLFTSFELYTSSELFLVLYTCINLKNINVLILIEARGRVFLRVLINFLLKC